MFEASSFCNQKSVSEENYFTHCTYYIQWNSVITNSVVNEHSVITNRIWRQINHFSTKIDPVATNRNGRSGRVFRYNRVPQYLHISRAVFLTHRQGRHLLPIFRGPKQLLCLFFWSNEFGLSSQNSDHFWQQQAVLRETSTPPPLPPTPHP